MITKYDYEKRFKDMGSDWIKINRTDMMKALADAYIEPDTIVDAMHDGMVVNTSFAQYRAMKRYILT